MTNHPASSPSCRINVMLWNVDGFTTSWSDYTSPETILLMLNECLECHEAPEVSTKVKENVFRRRVCRVELQSQYFVFFFSGSVTDWARPLLKATKLSLDITKWEASLYGAPLSLSRQWLTEYYQHGVQRRGKKACTFTTAPCFWLYTITFRWLGGFLCFLLQCKYFLSSSISRYITSESFLSSENRNFDWICKHIFILGPSINP